MQISETRDLFPGTQSKTFLDAACVSLIPTTANQRIRNFLDACLECPQLDASLHHIAMDNWRKDALIEAALLFNVNQDQVALVESTTHGLNIAANAIPFSTDDEVLIVDTEFLQVAIPFVKKAEKNSLRVRPVMTPTNRQLTVTEFLKEVSDKTKAICVSSVQWCTGARLPMHELGQFCKDKGIWLIVDGIQEAGALQVDLSTRYCDFFISGGHKWLNAPYGAGVMCLSSRALELQPSFYGYLSLPEPSRGWGEYFRDPSVGPFRKYDFAKTAKAFEIGGTSNYPGAIGLAASLNILNDVGIATIERQVLHLSRLLKAELKKLNLKIVSPDNEMMDSGITVFELFGDAQKEIAVCEQLLREKILVSVRYGSGVGGLRVSTHYFNNEDDVLKLVSAIKRLR